MFDHIQRATYESPMVVAMGPLWSAVAAGFAVVIMGQPYMTPAGERYLATLEVTDDDT